MASLLNFLKQADLNSEQRCHNLQQLSWHKSAREVAFVEKARTIGLAVNESKKKYLLSSIAKDSSIGASVESVCYNFIVVKNFAYLGSS